MQTAQLLMRMNDEQRECFKDLTRTAEAIDMVDDLTARVGLFKQAEYEHLTAVLQERAPYAEKLAAMGAAALGVECFDAIFNAVNTGTPETAARADACYAESKRRPHDIYGCASDRCLGWAV